VDITAQEKMLRNSILNYTKKYVDQWRSPVPYSVISKTYLHRIKRHKNDVETFLDEMDGLVVAMTPRGSRAVFTKEFYDLVKSQEQDDALEATLIKFDANPPHKARTL
jgi:hypothetical protein